jgi:DNA-binding transcriptional LysR family regulator
LEQWHALRALAEHGSVTAAAEALGKSQSTVSYLVQQLQDALGVPVVTREGRRTVLGETGRTLVDRAGRVLDEVEQTEALARQLAGGREPLVRLAVDVSFPGDLLIGALERFQRAAAGTRIELHEAVMSGVNRLLLEGSVDIAIGMTPPPGYLCEPLIDIDFLLVAAPGHMLLAEGRELDADDLERATQVVVRDSGLQDITRGWLSRTSRWSVSSMHAAYCMIRSGLCFGRMPRHWVEDDCDQGTLVELPMAAGGRYTERLHLTRSRLTAAGPAAGEVVAVLKDAVLAKG